MNSSPSRKNDQGAYASPTIRGSDPNAYWSPATQHQGTSPLSSNAPPYSAPGGPGTNMIDASMNLAAAEFVPNRGNTPNPQSTKETDPSGAQANDEFYFNENELNHDVDWTSGTAHSQCVATPQWKAAPMLQMSANLRQHLHAQALDLLRCLDSKDERYKEIPPRFHSVYPLDHSSKSRSATGSFGYPSAVFKVIENGVTYALRRIDNSKASSRVVEAAYEQWAKFRHPNVISLHQCFIHHRSLYFQYTYWPTAQTLADRFVGAHQPAPEPLLWSYLCQLCAAVRQVHGTGSALGCLSASRVLATGGNKVRISGVGIIDVLEHEQVIGLGTKQRNDMTNLGTCLLTVACRCFVTNQNIQQCIASLQNIYSSEFQMLISTLILTPPDIFTLCASISSHLVDELSMTYAVADGLESHLSCEYNNGRLFKLLLKLDYVCDESLEATGDRYMLRLFRNYLFRQVNEEGRQVVDIGHVVYSLNRLDMGEETQLLLASPDESTVLVVTFADLKMCLQNAFMELATNSEGGYVDVEDLGQKMSILDINHAPNTLNAPPGQDHYQGSQFRNPSPHDPPKPMNPSSAGFIPRSTGLTNNALAPPLPPNHLQGGGPHNRNNNGKNRAGGGGKGRRGGRRNH